MPEFILTLRKHSTLGFLLTAHLAEREPQNYHTIVEVLNESQLESVDYQFSEHQKRIVELIETYSEQKLSAIFNRKSISVHSFIQTIEKETVEMRIRPFIESKLSKLFDIIRETKPLIFFREGNNQILHPEDELQIKSSSAKTVFNITKLSDGTQYYLSVKHGDKIMKLNKLPVHIIVNQPCILVIENGIYFFEDIDAKKLLPFLTKEFIQIPKSSEKKWYESFASKAIKLYDVNARGFDISEKNTQKIAHITLENSWLDEFTFFIKFQYGTKIFLSNNEIESQTEFNESDFSFLITQRDKLWEQDIKNLMLNRGLIENSEHNFVIFQKYTVNKFQHLATIRWVNENAAIFERQDIIFKQNFGSKSYYLKDIRLDFKAVQNNDWFDIETLVNFGQFSVPFILLKENILNRQPEFLLPDGTFAIIPDEWFSRFEGLMLFGKNIHGKVSIRRNQFMLLNEKSSLQDVKKLSQLTIPENFEVQVPDEIRAELRPYQIDGFKWLCLLRENNLGGCLADDMGLGKTLQTITLLQDTVNQRKNLISEINRDQSSDAQNTKKPKIYTRKPSLIIMPVSLIHNWEFEIMRFSPFLKILKYWGGNRIEKFDYFDNFDIILTGYGVVRNDIERLSEYSFLYVILDESQAVKNSDSKTYQAVMQLQSEYRLVLTGTPIENSLSDLWSQFNFVCEGLLGSKEFFKQHFTASIEKDLSSEKSEQLRNLIRPFFLRRKKQEVAADLPELTEQIVYCRMSAEQKLLYDTEKSKIRNTLIIENQSKKDLNIKIITALTKLRQIACHPKLTDPEYASESGKFENVIGAIENLISENHKVLIFSSFVKHLNLFATYFNKNEYPYAMLTGATSDRAAAVERFRQNPEVRLFLISIKAGGTGLNLTEADYVFILDPWWNPAVEAQAVNRAHRIGQNKNVMVYRFITRKTVEEKIRQLQENKQILSDTFITENNPIAAFSMKEIVELFE